MSKTNVNYLSKEFFYNVEKQCVVCKLKFEIDLSKIKAWSLIDTDDDFAKYISKYEYNWAIDENDEYDFDKYVFTVYGKAKTDPSDTYDPLVGRNIALTRAQEKAFNIASDLYTYIGYLLDEKYFGQVDRLLANSLMASADCHEHVNEIITRTNG